MRGCQRGSVAGEQQLARGGNSAQPPAAVPVDELNLAARKPRRPPAAWVGVADQHNLPVRVRSDQADGGLGGEGAQGLELAAGDIPELQAGALAWGLDVQEDQSL